MRRKKMILELAVNLWMFACASVGSIYGLLHFFKPHRPMYLQLITCGVFCMMFSRLLYVVFHMALGEIWGGFDIGLLGIAGSFLFFTSASYGQIDALADDGSEKFRLTRIIALTGPVILICLYIVFFMVVPFVKVQIPVGLLTIVSMPCAYYAMKHLIIYDVEDGIIRSLRLYNTLILAYTILIQLELLAIYIWNEPMYIAISVCIGIVSLLILPVVKGGVDKWTK